MVFFLKKKASAVMTIPIGVTLSPDLTKIPDYGANLEISNKF